MRTMGKTLKATAKAITFRLLGAMETFTVAWLLTGEIKAAAGLMGIGLFTHTALYVGHEMVWTWATETEGD